MVSRSQAGTTTQFAYNADSITNAKENLGATTAFLIDNNLSYAQIIREDDGTAVVTYAHGDDLVSQNRAGVLIYYHQ